jgi:chromosome segregation ATPase
VADQTRSSSIAELQKAIRTKEHELAELDMILTDYHSERSSLIRELSWLQAQLHQVETAASLDPKP